MLLQSKDHKEIIEGECPACCWEKLDILIIVNGGEMMRAYKGKECCYKGNSSSIINVLELMETIKDIPLKSLK